MTSQQRLRAFTGPAAIAGIRVWLGMVLIQAGLGAVTVWSAKAADMATAHVVMGAMILSWGGLLSLLSMKFSIDAPESVLHSGRAATSINPDKRVLSAIS